MNALTEALSTALIHFVWQGSVVGLLLWLALIALRAASANARYVASCLALAVLLLLPLVTTLWVYEAQSSAALQQVSPARPLAAPVVSAGAQFNAAAGSRLAWLRSWALAFWSAGVLCFSVRIIWSCSYVYRLKRRGRAADEAIRVALERLARRMGIGRPIRVLISSMADGPSVVGWIRPVLLLPAASLAGLTPPQLEAVIAHELAHVRRLDYLVSAFQVVIETLLFYHPIVWWASSRIRYERELCCDDAAIRSCGDALCYAHALANLEKQRTLKPGIVMGAGGSGLFYRIQRIVGVKTMDYGPSKVSGLVVFCLAVAGIAASLGWLRAEPALQEKPARAAEQRKEAAQAEARLVAAREGQYATRTLRSVQDSPGVSVNLGSAVVIHRTGIEFPRAAIGAGIGGAVSAEVTLDGAGNVADARILTGPTELRRAVLESLLRWHFAADSSQNTRVVHVFFDSKAVQQERAELNLNARSEAGEQASRERLKAAQMEERSAEVTRKLDEQKKLELGLSTPQPDEIAKVRALAQQFEKQKADAAQADAAYARDLEEMKRRGELNDRDAAKMAEALKKRTAEEFFAVKLRPATVVGRVLSSVKFVGFSTDHSELTSRLPITVGQEISSPLIEKVGAAIRSFDEHLEYRFILQEQNGAELQIIAPGGKRPPY
jgi:beta-lactamase regulating signal transducer with metallopeptidase domain